nr:gamma-aminobutyric acid type B receptor subunit 2-like [Lytechinus pictus]
MRKVNNVIKDRHLIAIILVLLLIDITILFTKEIVDPYRVVNELIEQPRTQEDRANFVQYIHVYRRCSTKYNTVWTVILTVYKSFLMIFGAFLSFQTRTVSVPGLNDSYYVGLSIYNACLCCAVAVPLSLFNINSLNVTYTVTSGFIVFCATTILCTLFLPKLYRLTSTNPHIHSHIKLYRLTSTTPHTHSYELTSTNPHTHTHNCRLTSENYTPTITAIDSHGRTHRQTHIFGLTSTNLHTHSHI